MREVEAKFRVHPPFVLPDLVGDDTGVTKAGGPVEQELRAVYWDTSDLRLAREGITLRHRTGEGDADGWHLKLPAQEAGVPDASTGVRDELHASGPPDVVPDMLAELVTVYVRGAVLGAVATLVTHRTSYQLFAADGQPVAEVTDDVVSVLNQGHVAARFREIEIESSDGSADVVHVLGNRLRAAGAVGGEFVPKVVRALGPQATAQPDPPPPEPLGPEASARSAMQAILRRYVRALMTQDPRLRRGEDDSVHQMRVSARRLRSALKTFGPLVDDVWAKSLREELAWLADELGHARDGEVLLARLQMDLDNLPAELVLGSVRSKIEATLVGDLASAQNAAIETVRSERYLALIDRLVAGAWDPMTTSIAEQPADAVLRECVGRAWQRLSRSAERLRRASATDDDWHTARIAAKQVRYAAEAVVPIFGKRAKRLASKAEQIQELLGEHQDAVIAAATLRRLATGARPGSGAFTLGLLYARQIDTIVKTRDEFSDLWREVSRPAHRKWLRD